MSENVIVAIIAVSGTLLGAAIGGFAVWWTQREQIRHQERTLFHASKLEALSRFLDGMSKYFDSATNGTRMTLDVDEWVAAGVMANLLCSDETAAAIDAFGDALPPVGEVVTGAPLDNLTEKYRALFEALRRELGQE